MVMLIICNLQQCTPATHHSSPPSAIPSHLISLPLKTLYPSQLTIKYSSARFSARQHISSARSAMLMNATKRSSEPNQPSSTSSTAQRRPPSSTRQPSALTPPLSQQATLSARPERRAPLILIIQIAIADIISYQQLYQRFGSLGAFACKHWR